MLLSMKALEKYRIVATDGEIGHLTDFYFDDASWVTRYFVVDTGSWLSSRKVLLSPRSVQKPNWEERSLAVNLTKEKVRNSPDIDTDQPVSRQNEEAYLGYYGFGPYWGGGGLWGDGLYPYAIAPGDDGIRIDRAEREREEEVHLQRERARHRNDDPHLRSCNAVIGYHLSAHDGEVGHVAGFLMDEATWSIRYLIVDTSNWWMGHKVLVSPQWISGVHWADKTVSVDLSRGAIQEAPAYDPLAALSREWEGHLYRHYQRPGYWYERPALPADAL